MKNEKDTRKEIIDQRLKQAGWIVGDLTQVVEEYSFEINDTVVEEPSVPYGKIQISDYALLGKNGKFIGVVEAKKTSINPAIGREQAKQYCVNIQKKNGGELPFCFYTNGLEIYFWDIDNYPPRKIHGFPTRDDLERFQYIRKSKKKLADEFINTLIAGRDYQVQAIRSILEAIERRKREFLLVIATGTGKTRTCISLVDVLMKAGWAERVLFLVDRIALRDQALEAFKEYLPDEPRWPKVGEKKISTDRRIYVSTYPTMLNVINDEKNSLSPHFFDLIIVDESHRSIYNTYQGILNYFSTILLGLTATPTNVIDHNTFKLFDCDDGLPTFAYTYEEAVKHIPPYLCNFQVMRIRSKFQEKGIDRNSITLDDQLKLLREGKDVTEINYEGRELEKTVTNRGTNALIVREFMEESIKDSNGVLPGKTIFFCMMISHARRIEEIFDKLYPEYKGELAKVLVSDDPRVYGKGGLLDQFTNSDMPRIAISVDMLDTGIDVREITNLVFAKPIFSFTKFWQMIGRGTRLLEPKKLKPWCTEKDSFLILDCWDNFDYFKLNPKGKELKTQIPLPVRLFGLRLDKIEKAIELNEIAIAEKEILLLRSQIENLPKISILIIESSAILEPLSDDNYWINLTGSKIEFLRTAIKPLFRTISSADFKAMRFEKDILEVSLAHLGNEKDKFEILKESIIEEIGEFPLSINIVAKEENLIRQSQKQQYWATFNDSKGDELIEKLAPLTKYIEQVALPSGIEKLNLQDMLFSKEYVEFGPQHAALSISKYRELVEQRIKELTNKNPILTKLKNGVEISEEEVEILVSQLHDEHPHITLDLLRRVYNHRRADFVRFIKHILGVKKLESFPETVGKAFDAFIAEHSYISSRQLSFLNLLRDFILDHGELQKRDLIQSPFTMLHPEGIRGVFNPKEIEEILSLTQRVLAA